ncbi:TonB-dependent receptor plug domain-containing protein [Geofilum sp. OHC36d9]|uniref:TonB-dependent receptor plug domain-containing protein n=1 Tax=Geofilum sp. OHC36d9 TaxID=3458413 RepID=UPI004033D98B
MRFNRIKPFFTVILVFGCHLNAQVYFQQKTIPLKGVTIQANHLKEYTIGAAIEKPDSILVKLMRTSSLSDLLLLSTGASIKSYGPGGLSTVSFRGSHSNHTAIMWNGLNLQSPMNSSVNLSAMPASLFEDIQIQSGGAGTLCGSGAMSGVLHLTTNNLLNKKNHISVNGGIGSYNRQYEQLSLKTGNKKRASSLSVMRQSSDNNFWYYNTSRPDKRKERQTNAGVKQWGLSQDNYFRLGNQLLVTTGLWLQHYDKDVQTIMTKSTPNQQYQIDNNVMGAINLRYYRTNNIQINFKQGILWNQIDYTNVETPISSGNNQSLSLISEIESRISLKNGIQWSTGLNYTNEQAQSDGYIGTPIRSRWALFSFVQFKTFNNRLTSLISFRDEMTNTTLHPVIFAYGGNYALTQRIKIKGNISKNYRIPTFNDVYWAFDGYARGNNSLKPESGWSGDIGFEYNKKTAEQNMKLSTIWFTSNIKDWIIWLQDDDAIWTPSNKKRGESKGLELKGIYGRKIGSSFWQLSTSYFYTHSRLKTDDHYDGKQMVYIPLHKGAGLLTWKYKAIVAAFTINAVGERYYDYTNRLEPYLLGNIMGGYKIPAGRTDVQLNVKVNNLWNTQYQLMAWYAMPLCNYEVNLQVRL